MIYFFKYQCEFYYIKHFQYATKQYVWFYYDYFFDNLSKCLLTILANVFNHIYLVYYHFANAK